MDRGVRVARIPGPYVAGGFKTVPQLTWDGATLAVDPDCGLDLLWIEGAPRPFLDPRVNGGVTDPATRLALASTLQGGLSTLSMYTQTTIAGFQPGITSLHHGLIGQPPDDLSIRIPMDPDEVVVEASYTVGTAITGNPALSQRLAVNQAIRMGSILSDEEDRRILTITREALYTAIVESWVYLLDHPNYLIQPGDRICFNTAGKWHIFDRDGTTPPGQNAFAGLTSEVLGHNIPERCFLCWLDYEDEISVLVYNPERGSLGFTYAVNPDYSSWVMVWSSPIHDLPGCGVGSIEYGVLPLGAERCHELKLVKPLARGASIRRNCEIHFLPTEADVRWFAREFRIDLDPKSYPTDIGPDWDDPSKYDLKRCTFKTLRQAAGVY